MIATSQLNYQLTSGQSGRRPTNCALIVSLVRPRLVPLGARQPSICGALQLDAPKGGWAGPLRVQFCSVQLRLSSVQLSRVRPRTGLDWTGLDWSQLDPHASHLAEGRRRRLIDGKHSAALLICAGLMRVQSNCFASLSFQHFLAEPQARAFRSLALSARPAERRRFCSARTQSITMQQRRDKGAHKGRPASVIDPRAAPWPLAGPRAARRRGCFQFAPASLGEHDLKSLIKARSLAADYVGSLRGLGAAGWPLDVALAVLVVVVLLVLGGCHYARPARRPAH